MSGAGSDSPTAPSLAVIVVNWNGRDLLGDCIGSLLSNGYEPLHVVLVDNGSTDDSLAFCRSAFPSVDIVASAENLYWAGGNNLGLHNLGDTHVPDYILLLNNDTIVPEGSLRCLVDAMEEEPLAWAASPRICYAAEPSRIWYDGGRIGRHSGWVRHEGIRRLAGRRGFENRFVDFATGCAMMLTRGAVEVLGDLDEGYTLYAEDTDYCLRLREAGGRVLLVPRSIVLHKVSASVGDISSRKLYLRSRSHLRLLRLHWHRWRLLPLVPSQLAFFLGHAIWHLWHGRWRVARALLDGAIDELAGRPAARY
ncbi:glycosyltransferase family 2 protein [bacterium]|nr:glycosyltransferase family 2 protein [bacterium]MBU1675322.1 glycosyltransferase family 2 protein [bacterium]